MSTSRVRDYVHVTDLAEAHVLALKALQGKNGSASYNLGTEKAPAGQLIRLGWWQMRREPKIELGWKPRYHDLNQVIQTAWNWMVHRAFIAKPKRFVC